MLIVGEGPSTPLDLRALDFAKKFSDNVGVVDIRELDYDGIDPDLKEYFGSVLPGPVLLYADGLAEHTGHPLSVRRYMWKDEVVIDFFHRWPNEPRKSF